jgi:hypothetical protein
MERKDLKNVLIWPTIYRGRGRFVSFIAFGESRYFHSTPSPSVLTLILHLLLMRPFSFPELGEYFSKDDEKTNPFLAFSFTMKIFIRHILL